MPKTFITERDIEDMAHQGTMELALSDDTVLTDLAYEKANRLGVKLLQTHNQPPASPIPPYLSQPPVDSPMSPGPTQEIIQCRINRAVNVCHRMPANGELKRRVIEAVTARLGGQVDRALLSTIVERVFADLGVH